jgi:hypothetical protein
MNAYVSAVYEIEDKNVVMAYADALESHKFLNKNQCSSLLALK